MNSMVSVDKEEDEFSFHEEQMKSEDESLNGGDSCSSSAGSVVLLLPKDNVVVEASEEEASPDVIPVTVDNVPVYLSRSVDGTPMYIRRYPPTMEELLLTSPDESAPSFDGFSEASGSTFEGFSEVSRCSSAGSGSFEGFVDEPHSQVGENAKALTFDGVTEVAKSGRLTPPALTNSRKSRRLVVNESNTDHQVNVEVKDNTVKDVESKAKRRKRSYEQMIEEEGVPPISGDSALPVPSNSTSQDKFSSPKKTENNICKQNPSEVEQASPQRARRGRSRLNKSSEDNVMEPVEVHSEDEDFIGKFCNEIGCTISWLESLKVMYVPVTNGIVFELSEFADRIAWERYYVAVWILRMSGCSDIVPTAEDHSQIRVILKRRKALMVTLAGQKFGYLKLQEFDETKFTLLSAIKAREMGEVIYNEQPETIVTDVKRPKRQRVPKPLEEIDDSIENSALANTVSKQKTSDSVKNEEVEEQEEPTDEQSGNSNTCPVSFSTDDVDNTDGSNTDTLEGSEVKDSSNKKGKGTLGVSKSGRIRKPSAKGSVSIEFKYLFMEKQGPFSAPSSPNTHQSSEKEERKKSSPKHVISSGSKNEKEPVAKIKQTIGPKTLNRYVDTGNARVTFAIEDGRVIPHFKEFDYNLGPRCSAVGLTVRDLNTKDKLDVKLSNGVIKELFDFYVSRGSTLTSLACRLFWMLGVTLDPSRILSAVNKIGVLGRTLSTDHEKANNLFTLPEQISCRLQRPTFKPIPKIKKSSKILKVKEKILASKLKQTKSQRKALGGKKMKEQQHGIKQESVTPPASPPQEDPLIVDEDVMKTRGREGSITRGDIVYLYTHWLKNKRKLGNVFVTDLLKDVEQLMAERKVESIRVPAGTLMSSSVKLYEEYKQMSSTSKEDAIMYLEDDWLEDIQYLVSLSRPTRRSTVEGDSASSKTDIEDSACHQDISDSDISERNLIIDEGVDDKKSQQNSGSTDPDISKPEVESSDDSKKEGIVLRKSRQKNYSEFYSDFVLDFDNPAEVQTKEKEVIINKKGANAKGQRRKSTKLENTIEEPQELVTAPKEEYEVEKILDFRYITENNKEYLQYLVRWVGFNEDDDLWVNESDLHCPNILEEFWKAQDFCKKPDNLKMDFSQKGKNNTKDDEHEESDKSESILEKKGGSDKENGGVILKVLLQHASRTGKKYRRKSRRPRSVSVQEILDLYETWRRENQNVLIVGGSNTVNAGIFVNRVKKLMLSKGVKNFYPESLLSACFMMTLVRMRLKSDEALKNFLASNCIEILEASHKQQLSTRKKLGVEEVNSKESTISVGDLQKEFEDLNCSLSLAEEARMDSKCALSLVQSEIEHLENICRDAKIKNTDVTSCLQQELKKVKESARKSDADILKKRSHQILAESSNDEPVKTVIGNKVNNDAGLIEAKKELTSYGLKDEQVDGIMEMVMHKIGGHTLRARPQKIEKLKSS